jgi:hypothetical protein
MNIPDNAMDCNILSEDISNKFMMVKQDGSVYSYSNIDNKLKSRIYESDNSDASLNYLTSLQGGILNFSSFSSSNKDETSLVTSKIKGEECCNIQKSINHDKIMNNRNK